MAIQSPYREGDGLSPRTRNLISRGTMLALGLVMAYCSVRGLRAMYSFQAVAATQPAMMTSTHGRGSGNEFPLLAWLFLIGLGLIGGATIAAAVLPVAAMQAIFERWYTPPVTGDRGEDRNWRRLWLLGRWW